MRDIAFIAFLVIILGMALRRPFLFVLAYAYIDIVAPQRLSYYLLNSIPISMIVAALAIGSWLVLDRKKGGTVTPRQALLVLLLAWIFYTTSNAALPVEAQFKWEWAWKAMAWAIFLPFALRTKLRIEAYILVMVLSVAMLVITGGIKTVMAGGGYGTLALMIDNNSGLYEGSTLSTVAIALVPLIWWLARHGTIFPRDWRVTAFAAALTFSSFLIPVGTEARTGLLCIGVLILLLWRDSNRRILYAAAVTMAAIAAIPMLPESFTTRMSTIQGYQADSSASTRIAVWRWTWDYVQDNPLGGGFEVYRQNKIQVPMTIKEDRGGVEVVRNVMGIDEGRAFHNSYFEMLGEQGWPGLILFLLIHVIGLIRMERLRRRYWKAEGEKAWIAPLATALQAAQLIYLLGSMFVAIAFQPVILMLIAVQIAFDRHVTKGEVPVARPMRKEAEPALKATNPL